MLNLRNKNVWEDINKIEDESVDLIFTDPIYSNYEDYQKLAEEGYRILKNNKPLLVWLSQKDIAKIQPIFEEVGFQHIYTLTLVVRAKQSQLNLYKMITWSTPCLWFNKGIFKPYGWFIDTVILEGPPSNGSYKWAKNLEAIEYWLPFFSQLGNLVFDPFSGSGSVPLACKKLGRNCLGYEIDTSVYRPSP